jgi:hypothetical protein
VRLLAALILPLLAALAFAAPAAAAKPRAGQYIGETEKNIEVTLHVSGQRVRVEVGCRPGAPVSLGSAKLRRTRHGRRFALHARGPRIDISGRFSRAGTSARGRIRVNSAHCGSTGPARWTARYAPRPVREPSATFDGLTHQRRGITLLAGGRTIDLATFTFRCGYADGRTNLNAVALRRTPTGFAFSIKARGSVTYSDGFPDENAAISLSGRFNAAATRASGHIRVKSPRCGGTGRVSFVVKRKKAG